MSLTGAIAVYFVIWWTVLFAVLPWGVRTQAEEGDIVPGSAPSAPAVPLLRKKVLATTIVSAVVFVVVYVIVTTDIVTFDDIPFLPDLPNI